MSEVHVAVAIIINKFNEVLISLRPDHVHQGGFWEFPGGKLEKNESVFDALKREISEELDILVLQAKPYKIIRHDYSDKKVVLDVWLVSDFKGEARGAEGQQIKWIDIKDLKPEIFPVANRSIIKALQLPDRYMITGEFKDHGDFLNRLEIGLKKGIKLVQLRCKNCTTDEYLSLVSESILLCESYQSTLLLNSAVDLFKKTHAHGLHLTGKQLQKFESRPVDKEFLLSVSCHTLNDIKKAKILSADIILLSPVKETKSHPGVAGIGWELFSELISNNDIPVYALGGMTPDDIDKARVAGAQGIAAISCFWAEFN